MEVTENGDLSFENQLTRGLYVMSKCIRDARVRTPEGLNIGEDRTGYVANDKPWRPIHFV